MEERVMMKNQQEKKCYKVADFKACITLGDGYYKMQRKMVC